MVRLVFRPYTQISRSICTSEPLRASTRVSPGFTLLRYSSPSFGSQQVCLHSNLSPKIEVGCYYKNYNCHFHYAHTVSRHVLAHVCGLLGPCFKTGHSKPFGTDAEENLCLEAPNEQPSAHAPSELNAEHRSRKCSPLINKPTTDVTLTALRKRRADRRCGRRASCISNQRRIPRDGPEHSSTAASR